MLLGFRSTRVVLDGALRIMVLVLFVQAIVLMSVVDWVQLGCNVLLCSLVQSDVLVICLF